MDDKSYSVLVDACVEMNKLGVNVVCFNPGEKEAAQLRFIFADDETTHRLSVVVVLADKDMRHLLTTSPNWPSLVENMKNVTIFSTEISARLPRTVGWTCNNGLITLTADSAFYIVASSIF